MKIVKKISEIKEIVSNFKKNKKEINLIPTMGNIHAGHLSLLSEANTFDGINIVSIFVNPTQFNDEDDFNNYPNTFEADIEILSKQTAKSFLPLLEIKCILRLSSQKKRYSNIEIFYVIFLD